MGADSGKDLIGYNALVENGLRTVVREALRRVAEEGWPGTHHAYLTFRTGAPGVVVPDFLRQRYPEELTIVLQHQFWGLEVSEESFSVTLSFNKVGQRITVPFAALTSYADPSIKFGLQFGQAPQSGRKAGAKRRPPAAADAPREVRGEEAASAARREKIEPEATEDQSDATREANGEEAGGDKVVALDRFRKK